VFSHLEDFEMRLTYSGYWQTTEFYEHLNNCCAVYEQAQELYHLQAKIARLPRWYRRLVWDKRLEAKAKDILSKLDALQDNAANMLHDLKGRL